MNEDDGGREVEKMGTDFSAGHTSFLGYFYLILANDKNPTVKRNFKCSLRAALYILTVKAGAGLNSGSQRNADRKIPTDAWTGSSLDPRPYLSVTQLDNEMSF